MKDIKQVGFIGLGRMGMPMARNVIKGGFQVQAYNRTASRTEPLVSAGAVQAITPAEATSGSDAVIIMVSAPPDLLDILQRTDGVLAALRPGQLVINMTTVSTEATLLADRLVRERGGHFLDAPVSGTVGPAEAGTLVILLGATSEDAVMAEPLLLTMGKTIIACGGVGGGTAMKLSVNLLLGIMMQGFAEAIAFGRSAGLPLDTILAAVNAGALRCGLFEGKGTLIREGDYAPRFSLDLLLKDLRLAESEVEARGQTLKALIATREAFQQATEAGLGGMDMAAAVKPLVERS